MSENTIDTEKLESQLDELKRRLAIDTAKLTEALIEQPTLALAARELVVECTAARDRAKYDLEVNSAERDAQLREEAAEARERLTEARVTAMVSMDPGVIRWKYALIDANKILGAAQAVADSYSQRSWMLRELSHIHGPFERDRFEGLAPPPKSE